VKRISNATFSAIRYNGVSEVEINAIFETVSHKLNCRSSRKFGQKFNIGAFRGASVEGSIGNKRFGISESTWSINLSKINSIHNWKSFLMFIGLEMQEKSREEKAFPEGKIHEY
jgi:hypothetical protein